MKTRILVTQSGVNKKADAFALAASPALIDTLLPPDEPDNEFTFVYDDDTHYLHWRNRATRGAVCLSVPPVPVTAIVHLAIALVPEAVHGVGRGPLNTLADLWASIPAPSPTSEALCLDTAPLAPALAFDTKRWRNLAEDLNDTLSSLKEEAEKVNERIDEYEDARNRYRDAYDEACEYLQTLPDGDNLSMLGNVPEPNTVEPPEPVDETDLRGKAPTQLLATGNTNVQAFVGALAELLRSTPQDGPALAVVTTTRSGLRVRVGPEGDAKAALYTVTVE